MAASKTLSARARGVAQWTAGALRSSDPVSLVILALGVAGGVLLVITELSTIVTVDVLTTGTCEEIADPAVRDACSVSGFEQHGGALVLLGLVAAVMTIGAARGSSRPAAVALVAIAVIVLAFAILRDVPKTGETGLIGINYEAAMASAGPALFLEIAGAVALAIAGLATLLRRRDQTARSDA